MSRGFVKEDDQEEIPLVPPRADLPADCENYVTQTGYELLLAERDNLLREQENLDPSRENEYRISFNHLNARLQLLEERISTAKILDLEKMPRDEVRFGAIVTYKNSATGQQHKFQIVGVDEANIAKKKISFVTPLAKALMNKKIGKTTLLDLGERKMMFEILNIQYED